MCLPLTFVELKCDNFRQYNGCHYRIRLPWPKTHEHFQLDIIEEVLDTGSKMRRIHFYKDNKKNKTS